MKDDVSPDLTDCDALLLPSVEAVVNAAVPHDAVERVKVKATLIDPKAAAIHAIVSEDIPNESLRKVKDRAMQLAVASQYGGTETSLAPSQYEVGIGALESQRPRRMFVLVKRAAWAAAAGVVVVALPLLFLPIWPNQRKELHRTKPDSPTATYVTSPSVPTSVSPDRTMLEERWRATFPEFSADLTYLGSQKVQSDVRFSDDLSGLRVRAHHGVRLIKLGVLRENDDLTISIRALPQSGSGTFGFFAGLDIPNGDFQEPVEFHQVVVGMSEQPNSTLVNLEFRTVRLSEGSSTIVASEKVGVRRNVGQVITLKVRLKPGHLSAIGFDGIPLETGSTDTRDLQCLGSYGIVVQDGSFLLLDPQLKRNRE